jgi:hypothetical protein
VGGKDKEMTREYCGTGFWEDWECHFSSLRLERRRRIRRRCVGDAMVTVGDAMSDVAEQRVTDDWDQEMVRKRSGIGN